MHRDLRVNAKEVGGEDSGKEIKDYIRNGKADVHRMGTQKRGKFKGHLWYCSYVFK